jgi:uncharacterized protein (TIGR01777 family)
MKGKRVIVAGGSGFLGTALAQALVAREAEVIVLTRKPSPQNVRVKEMLWDGRSLGPWAEHLDGAAAVVSLAGRNVDCRHTPENVRQINESRVDSVRCVAEAIRRCNDPPVVFVQAAGQSIYGERGDHLCDEAEPPGEGFLAGTCRLWEQAFESSATPATRRVLLRIGFVLSGGGGALKKLASLTKWGLGGQAGSGGQYISWIDLADMVRCFLFAIERQDAKGVFNACAPNPVTNAEFMRELRRALHRPWSPPAPVWAVRVGALLMRTDPRLALTGCRCEPRHLLEKGFTFRFTSLRESLEDIYGSGYGERAGYLD